MARRDIAQFEAIDAKPFRQGLRLVLEGRRGRSRFGDNSAVDRERQRDQRVAEKEALDMRERQYAFDAPSPPRVQEMRTMPEDLPDHLLPAGSMEKRRPAASRDEGIPPGGPGRVTHSQRPNFRFRRRLGRQTQFGGIVFHDFL